jgi:transitional endoplasmic reticulum ATPase
VEREYEQIQAKIKQEAMSAGGGGMGFISPGMLTPRGPKG